MEELHGWRVERLCRRYPDLRRLVDDFIRRKHGRLAIGVCYRPETAPPPAPRTEASAEMAERAYRRQHKLRGTAAETRAQKTPVLGWETNSACAEGEAAGILRDIDEQARFILRRMSIENFGDYALGQTGDGRNKMPAPLVKDARYHTLASIKAMIRVEYKTATPARRERLLALLTAKRNAAKGKGWQIVMVPPALGQRKDKGITTKADRERSRKNVAKRDVHRLIAKAAAAGDVDTLQSLIAALEAAKRAAK